MQITIHGSRVCVAVLNAMLGRSMTGEDPSSAVDQVGDSVGARHAIVFHELSESPEEATREAEAIIAESRTGTVTHIVMPAPMHLGLESMLARAGIRHLLQRPVHAGRLADAVLAAAPALHRAGERLRRCHFVLHSTDDARPGASGSTGTEWAADVVRIAVDRADLVDCLQRFVFDAVVIEGSGDPGVAGILALPGVSRHQTALIVVSDDLGGDMVRRLFKTGVADWLSTAAAGDALGSAVESVLLARRRMLDGSMKSADALERAADLRRVNENLRIVNGTITEANQRLERQGHVKDEMVGTASHELKSPLAAISGALEILCSDRESRCAADSELLELARRNCARMTKLVNDLLDLGRVEAGRIALRVRPLAPVALLEQAIAAVTMRARARAIRFAFPEHLPDRTVALDEGLVEQMLVNLLENAVKFAPPGSIVDLHVTLTRRQIHFVVTDAGPGIPREDRRRVFERFYRRSRGDDPSSAGSGLGLTITQALARLHGGTVTIGSGVDGGARITISLPLDGVRAEAR